MVIADNDAHVYRWADREGHLHYSDLPAPNSVAVNPHAPGVSDSAAVAAAADNSECERRRKQADSYRNASAISETNSLGETRQYSDAERQKLIERADTAAREACGGAK